MAELVDSHNKTTKFCLFPCMAKRLHQNTQHHDVRHLDSSTPMSSPTRLNGLNGVMESGSHGFTNQDGIQGTFSTSSLVGIDKEFLAAPEPCARVERQND